MQAPERTRRLQVHEPAAGLAAGAVLVGDRAAPAVPELPPDPLEVIHLEDEEGDDPEHDLGARHDVQRIGALPRGAMGRAAQIVPAPVLSIVRYGTERSSERPLRPELFGYYQRRAPARPMPPAKRAITQMRA